MVTSARDDGAAGFSDPSVDAGYIPSDAAVADSTYTTSALNYSGFEISHNTATINALYDNLALQLQDIPVAGTPREFAWNPSGGSGASDGSGTWGSPEYMVRSGASANATWDNTNPDNATFGAGSGPGAATVNLTNSQTAGMITFAAGSPTYTLTGSNFIISGFTVGATTRASSRINPQISIAA